MQDFITSQIVELSADEAAWGASFAKNKDITERVVQEVLEQVERGRTRPLDELLNANSNSEFPTEQ